MKTLPISSGLPRLICEDERFSGRIKTRRKSPGATGYEWDLYRVEGLPEADAHLVETKFMGMVDTDAKRALDKIISGDETPWDERMRRLDALHPLPQVSPSRGC
jgi:hypothetical protein